MNFSSDRQDWTLEAFIKAHSHMKKEVARNYGASIWSRQRRRKARKRSKEEGGEIRPFVVCLVMGLSGWPVKLPAFIKLVKC